MPYKQYPGVYVEETSSTGPGPITPASTSVTCFVGVADGGPHHEAVEVTSLASFEEAFGTASESAPFLPAAAGQFFANGGRQLRIVRVASLSAGDVLAGLAALEHDGETSVLAVPGLTDPEVLQQVIAWVEAHHQLVLVVDGPPPGDDDEVAAVQAYRAQLGTPSLVALYWPWLAVEGGGLAPPSGFLAGLYAQVDREQGVHRSPAGIRAVLRGCTDVATQVTDARQGPLNEAGINVIRRFPQYGVVPWGARTLHDGHDYRYVAVRRMELFLRKSIYWGTTWVAFEPNGDPLWAKVRSMVSSFLMNQYLAGAFVAHRPREAFFVKCDASNNGPGVDPTGLNILVGFAPVKPAEFVVITLRHLLA